MKTIINFWISFAYAPGDVPVLVCRYFKKKSKPGCMYFAMYLGTSTQVLGRTGTVYWGTGTRLSDQIRYLRFFGRYQDMEDFEVVHVVLQSSLNYYL